MSNKIQIKLTGGTETERSILEFQILRAMGEKGYNNIIYKDNDETATMGMLDSFVIPGKLKKSDRIEMISSTPGSTSLPLDKLKDLIREKRA